MRQVALLASALLALAAAGCGAAEEPTAPAPDAQAAEAARLGVPAAFDNDLGMHFVLVPAGTFAMGSVPGASGRSEDEVLHDAQLVVAYYVQADETTPDQYARGTGRDGPVPKTGAAAGLSYGEAVAFAARLTERDPRWRYRLPTEAEWERAARAGGGPARADGRNAWGLSGTTDGAWEWCSDRYGPYPDFPVMNPTGPNEGAERVLRGGDDPACPDPRARLARRRRAGDAAGVADAGVRLVATLSYGKADVGLVELSFVAVDEQAEPGAPRERDGYEVRLIAVFDRLYSRQQGITPLPWVSLRSKTPVTLRVPPGRYYAQAQKPGGGPGARGVEIKFQVDGPPARFELPVPRPGQTLDEPQ